MTYYEFILLVILLLVIIAKISNHKDLYYPLSIVFLTSAAHYVLFLILSYRINCPIIYV